MEIDKKDLMAIARSRAQRGKLTLWLIGTGLVWLMSIIIGLIMLDKFSSMLYWVLSSIVLFLIGMLVFTIYIETKAIKIRKELEEGHEYYDN
ncbi:MAG: hypothetical protein WC516_08750 [Patescibacteria group bacterium]|jgi:membrane protein YdbS with pleckstrin-like domain